MVLDRCRRGSSGLVEDECYIFRGSGRIDAIVVFKTFWAVFGRINEFHYADVFRFDWWFVGMTLLGIVVYMFSRNNELPRKLAALFALAIVLSLVTTLYYAHYYDSDRGRDMFPSILPIATFIAIGLTTLFPEKYHR
jgi:surface polysaccharide O-acyltransferase-like enzyme